MSSTIAVRFGDLLRRHRQAAGLTQEELAERAGLSRRGIADLERGARKNPHRDTVTLLADALGLPTEDRAALFAAARRSGTAPRLDVRQADVADGKISPQALPDRVSSLQGVSQSGAAAALPTGTPTFLFTDIAGSTDLLQRLGPAYARALDQHRVLLRAAFTAHHGHEVDTQGDAFFVAFPTAPEAVAAAAEVTRVLAGHAWPEGAAIQVRIGLHTGTPLVVDDHYVGLDIHRAARIAAAGHGGQVLLSRTTRDLVEEALPVGAMLRDLGEHHLKDLQRSEHLYQLVLSGLPADFPPLRTLDRQRHNLPVQPTTLVGRDEAVANIAVSLRKDDARLITLTGPGGVGKTRLGMQVAAKVVDAFADGAWLVRLAQLNDPGLVVPTIMQTLGVKEVGGRSPAETLREYLRGKRLLLLLDNFEQVAPAAPEVAALLESSAGLKVLVTSRTMLHLRGEKEIAVPPLALPAPDHLGAPDLGAPDLGAPDLVAQCPAVALFVQRARDANSAFQLTDAVVPAVAAICAQLDGLPLAIELAAARIKVLPPHALLQRLERRLPVLTGGARDLPERQQTMRAAIMWSYDLLSMAEQRLFRRLAVFVGGCTLEAVEAVCAAPQGAELLGLDVLEGLTALVDQSLLRQETASKESGEARFRLLYVLRGFALEELAASGEAEAVGWAHTSYFELLAGEAFHGVMGGLVEAQWVRQLERDHDNLRAALTWLRSHGEVERDLRLALGVSALWEYAGLFTEGRRWLDELVDVGASGTGSDAMRVQALRRSSLLAMFQQDLPRAMARGEEALALARTTGDLDLIATALSWQAMLVYEQAELAEQSEQAERYLEEGVALARQVRSARLPLHLIWLGLAKLLQGKAEHAVTLFQEAASLALQAGDREALANALQNVGAAYGLLGDAGRARTALEEALHLFREQGYVMGITWSLIGLAVVSAREGDAERAARLFGAQEAVLASIGGQQPPFVMRLADQMVAPARTQLGEERWEAAYAVGRTLSLEQAITEALGRAGEPSEQLGS